MDVKTLWGRKSIAIPILSDSMYNNTLYSGVGETPFQSATQTVYSFAVNVTNKHQIIKVVTKNKICSRHDHSLDEGTADHHYIPDIP